MVRTQGEEKREEEDFLDLLYEERKDIILEAEENAGNASSRGYSEVKSKNRKRREAIAREREEAETAARAFEKNTVGQQEAKYPIYDDMDIDESPEESDPETPDLDGSETEVEDEFIYEAESSSQEAKEPAIPPLLRNIAEHPPTARQVPHYHKKMWQFAAAKCFQAYLDGRQDNDEEAVFQALLSLLKLPSNVLRIQRSGKGYSNMLRRQLYQFLRTGEVDEQPPQGESKRSADDKNFSAARRHIKMRNLSKANAALDQLPLYSNNDLLQKLRQLHPQRVEEFLPKPEGSLFLVDAAEFLRFVRRLPKSSSPGPSAWTYELIQQVMGNDICQAGMIALVTDILNGALCNRSSDLFLSATLTPIAKGEGIRPIAIGEVFYRMASSFAVRSHISEIRSLLQPLQLGIATAGGCEIVLHALQAIHENEQEPRVIVSLDFSNAFQEISRSHILSSVAEIPSLKKLFSLIWWSYARKSPMLLMDTDRKISNVLLSTTGVRQGCPLGSLLFCLGVRELYANVAKIDPRGHIFAIIDDLTLAVKAENARECLEYIETEAPKIGLRLGYHKSSALCNSNNPTPPDLKNMLTARGIVLSTQTVKLLGSPLGRDMKQVSDFLLQVVQKKEVFFQRLLDDRLSTQEAMILLRSCKNLQLSYYLRTCRPAATSRAATKFDELVMSTAERKIRISNLSEQQLSQIRRPLRLGGFGLTSSEATTDIAWFSAQALAISHFGAEAAHILSSDARTTTSAASLVSINASIGNPKEPNKLLPKEFTSASCFTHYERSRTNLQHQLTELAQQHEFDESLANAKANISTLARLRASAAPKASLWLSAVPTSAEFRLENWEFENAARFRLGISPLEYMQDYCRACNVDLQAAPWHHLSCPKRRKPVTRRHDIVVRMLNSWITKLGAFSCVEPRRLSDEDERRPDIDVQLGNQRFLIDVTVRNPTCPSHLVAASKKSLATAAAAEREKTTKYRDIAKDNDATFVPFAIETYGGIGDEANKFVITLIAVAKKLQYTWAPSEIVSSIRHSIAVAIQKENACIVFDGLRREL